MSSETQHIKFLRTLQPSGWMCIALNIKICTNHPLIYEHLLQKKQTVSLSYQYLNCTKYCRRSTFAFISMSATTETGHYNSTVAHTYALRSTSLLYHCTAKDQRSRDAVFLCSTTWVFIGMSTGSIPETWTYKCLHILTCPTCKSFTIFYSSNRVLLISNYKTSKNADHVLYFNSGLV